MADLAYMAESNFPHIYFFMEDDSKSLNILIPYQIKLLTVHFQN